MATAGRVALAFCVVALALSACGRKGDPKVPEPAIEIEEERARAAG